MGSRHQAVIFIPTSFVYASVFLNIENRPP